MLRIPEAFGKTRARGLMHQDILGPSSQSKTEQIQERQDETLICNLKFVFLSIISFPLIIMNF